MAAVTELVFIPFPAMGHITPTVEFAKRLVRRDPRISVTIVDFKIPMLDINPFIKALDADPFFDNKRIKFLQITEPEKPQSVTNRSDVENFHQTLIQSRPVIKREVEKQVMIGPAGSRLAGIVVDLFCTAAMAIADDLNVPSYVFFTSNSSTLTMLLHFQYLRDHHGVPIAEWEDREEFDIPGFSNRVPYKLLPDLMLEKDVGNLLLNEAKNYRAAKGILLNTFEELESHTLGALCEDDTVPTEIYPVGPIINVDSQIIKELDAGEEKLKLWLDDQPPASVVFLCFGSLGGFLEDQVREIAKGLERSGHRFLWSLRQPPTVSQDGKIGPQRDYTDLESVLPVGFLGRTADRGKIIGWAPQVAILSHPAVGGFVSHCGWNSTLESLWFGVPIAAWPLYAEQQMNALMLVKELGMAVEIRMDFKWDHVKMESNVLVEADVIEKAVRELMDKEENNAVRMKVKEMSEVGRKAAEEGGSSYNWLGRFIEDVFENIDHKEN
ncbi:hypothetical protein Dimus_014369 [Dionaea muscipula]